MRVDQCRCPFFGREAAGVSECNIDPPGKKRIPPFFRPNICSIFVNIFVHPVCSSHHTCSVIGRYHNYGRDIEVNFCWALDQRFTSFTGIADPQLEAAMTMLLFFHLTTWTLFSSHFISMAPLSRDEKLSLSDRGQSRIRFIRRVPT